MAVHLQIPKTTYHFKNFLQHLILSKMCATAYLSILLYIATTSVHSHSPLIESIYPAQYKNAAVRFSRQVSDAEVKRCSNSLLNTQCSVTQYAQDLINTFTTCGPVAASIVTNAEGACRQNSNGDYCGAAFIIYIDALTQTIQNCAVSCTTECRTNLTNVMTTVGCCLQSNTAFVVTLSPSFTRCNLSMPSPCQDSSLTIPSAAATSCSIMELQQQSLEFQCLRSNQQPVIDALRTSNCEEFARIAESNCFYRNGKYCSQQFSQTPTSLTSGLLACTSTSSCTTDCQTQIRAINNDLGCCVNSFNITFMAIPSSTLAPFCTITDNALWNACGVTPPGECEIRLNATTTLMNCSKFLYILAIIVMAVHFE